MRAKSCTRVFPVGTGGVILDCAFAWRVRRKRAGAAGSLRPNHAEKGTLPWKRMKPGRDGVSKRRRGGEVRS